MVSDRFIGLLMVADEDDILGRTLEINAGYVDCFYVLNGSNDTTRSEDLLTGHEKCWGYWTDNELPEDEYGTLPADGWRGFLYDEAADDHGYDNWFVLLHGDEIWTRDPRYIVAPRFDGYVFRLPFYFPRAGEPWDYTRHPVDQLSWHLGPGWPEFRMFRGGDHVSYDPYQHFDVKPRGVDRLALCMDRILHYPYRSPEVQRARAARHEQTRFDPDNFQHIVKDDAVYWTDDMIAERRSKPSFADLYIDKVMVR